MITARHWWYVGFNVTGLAFCAASGFISICGDKFLALLILGIAVAFFVAARRQLRGF